MASNPITRELAIFRCDADEAIGGGHVVRCMGLAEALQHDGWSVAFAVSSKTPETVPALGRSGWQIVTGFDGGEDEVARLRTLWPGGIDLVVMDHYGLRAEDEAALLAAARQRLVINDFPTRRHVCEFLVDQTIGRKPEEYAGHVPSGCQVLAGATYAVLRSAFSRARSLLGPPAVNADLRRLVVSFGMVDAPNLTATALKGLARTGFAGVLDVVLGAGAPHIKEIRALIAARRGKGIHRLHTDVDAEAMAALLARCDLAIGAAGVSSYERCCLGVPAMLVMLAENQRDNVRALIRSGAARHLGWWEDVTPEAIGAAVRDLAARPDVFTKMRRAALQQTDGRGAYRIALAIRPLHTRAGEPVSLRPALFDDAELLYCWQQAPETRRYARNPEVPTWSEHIRWLAAKLDDPGTVFNVIEVDGAPAGVLRFDARPSSSDEQECYEISILVAPEFYRRGVAVAALKAGRRLLPAAELQAAVFEPNFASKKLFERAGFHRFGERYRQLPRRECLATIQ